MESMRPQDMTAESVVAEYLDRYFYPVVMVETSCSWRRVHSIEEQLAGIDIRSTTSRGRTLNIDEKAQIDYLRSPLPTFVLELGFIAADGKHQRGWFLNDELSTDVYLFVWPRADADKWHLSIEDIKWCECMMVPKSRLRLALGEKGWNAEALSRFEELMRAQKALDNKSKPLMEWEFVENWENVSDVPDVKACRSSQLSEDPINLVVKKRFLSRFATGHYMVYPEVVEVLEKPDSLSWRSIPHSAAQDAR